MSCKNSRRGLVLLLVLVVIAMLSLGAYSFTNLMLAYHEAAVAAGRQVQARSLVDSGVTATQLFLSEPEATRLDNGGIFDNPERFRGVIVLQDDDPLQRGAFSAISPGIDQDGNLNGIRYGLEDESTRLNLNVLLILDQQVAGSGRTLLMALPGMTEDVADAILDWLDPDDTPREAGAEVDYYSGLSPAYAPKNGPVDTVEELLLVRGVTPQLLFGVDINHNYQLDRHEQAEENTGGASTDPNAFRGWAAYLTMYSVEWNITPDGNPKVYLNTADLNRLVEDMQTANFPQDWINFIVAYRQVGPSQSTTTVIGAGNSPAAANTPTANTSTQPQTGELNMDLPAQTPIGGILDLIGAQVQYTFAGAPAATPLNSPFTVDGLATYLQQLMDYCTVNPAATIPGRININQCSASVLAGIPGMTVDISAKILSTRTVDLANADPSRRYETWLLTEGVVTLDQMKVLMPFICGGGSAYRCQVIGFFQDGKAYSRAECVFDATSPLPRILLWRDLTHLGRGYSMEMLGANFSR
jgi:hypothetical protein